MYHLKYDYLRAHRAPKQRYNNNNNIYLKSSIQTSSIDYKNYYGMYKYNKYDYTN